MSKIEKLVCDNPKCDNERNLKAIGLIGKWIEFVCQINHNVQHFDFCSESCLVVRVCELNKDMQHAIYAYWKEQAGEG